MRLLIAFFFVLVFMNCMKGPEDSPQQGEDPRHPPTPSREILEGWCNVQADSLKPMDGLGPNGRDLFYLDDKPFTGWACHTQHGSSHRYRYSKYKDGLLTWQIGYFDNEQLEHDFRKQDGLSMGSERIWRSDGTPYINHYFKSPGIMDGLQVRWHSNGKVAREAMFEDGDMIYEVLLNKYGHVTRQKGQIPGSEE